MSIGKNIARYRKAKKLTQEELGARLGITNQAVSKWESEISYPDILLLPRIADELEITINDLYATDVKHISQARSNVFDMDKVHSFPREAQSMLIDTLYRETNLLSCNSWDFLKVPKNPITKKYDSIKKHHTLSCISENSGASFISNNQAIIDCGIDIKNIGTLFNNIEITSGLKKLADSNVRSVLSYICNQYFHSSAPFNSSDSEYFEKDIKPIAVSHAIGLTSDETLEAMEKLITLHIIYTEARDDGIHYLLQKLKAIELAVILRAVEGFICRHMGFGCGDFAALTDF
ncbi:MAG: helix-turn-helix transcriptional regulator [Clostridia bacterium]|nr:helix-turn-helix transcriptional regulator [Clostridia bacterium]